jgi:predicted AAA+ superfamily ATPase
MPRLLRLLALQAASLFNSLKISRALGLDHKTVKSYVKLLETVFLVKRLPAWRPGLGSRETATPKIYIVDSGLLANLLGANETRIATDPQITGNLLDNFVAMEIVRLSTWAEALCTPYHYRQDRDEVDVVLETRSG